MTTILNTDSALLLSPDNAAILLGISRSKFYSMQSCGQLGPMPIELGGCRRWRRKEIEAWVDAGCPGREQWEKLTQEHKGNG